MKIRQIALVAEELTPVRQTLFSLLDVEAAFVDEGVGQFGLQNIVMTIGETFLEVVSPVEQGTTAGRLLRRRGGDSGYMVIMQVDDLAAEKQRLATTDIRIAWEVDTGKAAALHLHPRDVGGALPSLDQMIPPAAWYWAGPGWESRAAKNASAITGAQLQTSHPEVTAQRWALALGRDYFHRGGVPVLALADTELRFVEVEDDRGDGLQGIDMKTPNLDTVISRARELSLPIRGNTVTVCGTQINFS